ncbi:MAG: hypothetical protein J6334_07120 [Kiritimatiellae bacterium]|nr:hypothetical protein [Kiritimatiellia bacterium]
MTVSYYLPFGDEIINPGTDYVDVKPGYSCKGWYKDGDATEALVRFKVGESSERVPKGGVTFRQKWVAEEDQTSAGRFLSLGSTYGVIDSISAGTTGPVTQSAKGRQLAARTAPQSTFTLKHAVYPAYTYYTVLRCDDLANPVWTAIEDSRQVTGVTATSVAIPVEGKRGFFRLLLSTKPLTKGATKLDQ